ncbi:PLP-dependent aminotransferase family protein [Marinobacterium sp. D7]|uniref:aminotransferase-like domain-containing protein n=1 Tax=Marinobacterium ramblicola TaxID=2849041 RepID=UPI001C2D223E|nr:PLP-dependent aminotransferase family protein [Marinobacterium ramblicola]MBV1788418.1 PLP-dependent aminotransferase family protein [Marinobacterium ramblicola]
MALQIPKPEEIIDLGIGQPDPDLLPTALFRSLSLRREDLAYGEEAGDGRFRYTLANWLSGEYDHPVDADQLMVTAGTSQALDLICTRLARPGDTVLVEDPSYFIALKLFAEHGLKPVAIAMDDQGIRPDLLEPALQQHQPAFIYTIPSYHNPTGVTQPSERREQLVALAKRYHCPLLADEVYQCLYFDRKPPPPLACYDPQAPVLSLGSFSKILAPGLRLGWIQGSEATLLSLLSSPLFKSGGGLAPVSSALVEPLIANGEFQQYLVGLRQTYRSRLDLLYRGLCSAFGGRVQIARPDGGYFLWVSFTDGNEPIRRLEAAKAEGVGYFAGPLFSADKGCANSMRLCFAWYPETELTTACNRLASLFEAR